MNCPRVVSDSVRIVIKAVSTAQNVKDSVYNIVCRMHVLVLQAAVTSYQTHTGLKRCMFVLSKVWRPEIQNQVLASAKASKEEFFAFSSFWWLTVFLGIRQCNSSCFLRLCSPSFLYVSVSFFLWLIKKVVIGCRTHLNPAWSLEILNYICKTLIPNKFAFWGSGGEDFWNITFQPITMGMAQFLKC